MKVAVTGATGFVGTHVLRELARRTGVEVVGASRRPPADGALPGKARHVVLDLADPSADAFERLGRPDVLIHLAWAGLPNYRSLHHFETELPRQYAFLRALVGGGLLRLFVAGTCYEYGMSSGELDEAAEAAPSNPYGYAKGALRRQLEFLRADRPFALTWARMFYMYGAGQPPGSLYTQLAAAAARGDTRFAMSGGEQLRDFLPVERIAQHIVEVALKHPDAGVVNICSGQPTSVRSLVERLMAANGWALELDLGKYPYPSYEPLAFWGSAAKLHTLIGSGGEAPP